MVTLIPLKMCLRDREHISMLATILDSIVVSLGGSKPQDSPEIVQIFPFVSKKFADILSIKDFCFKSYQVCT